MTNSVLTALAPARVHDEGASNAPVLDEYLQKVEGRRKRVLYNLFARVKDIYRHKARPPEEVEEADEALKGLASVPAQGAAPPEGKRGGPGEGPPRALAELAAEHSALSGRLAACAARRAELAAVAAYEEGLAGCRALLAQGQYEEAAQQQQQLDAAAAESPALPPALLEAGRQQRAALLEEVTRWGRASLEADALSQTLQVSLPANPLGLWRPLEALGQLEAVLQVCAAGLLQQLVLPMLSCPEPLGVEAGAATPREAVATFLSLHWTSGEPPAGPMAQGAPHREESAAAAAGVEEGTFEATVLQLLEFLSGSVFAGHPPSAACLGRHLWPPLASAYIAQRLAPALPPAGDPPGASRAPPPLEGFQAAAKRAQRFEDAAAALGYVPTHGTSRGRLQDYVRHALDKFVHAQRLQVVAEARDLLMLPASETLVVGTEDVPEGGPQGDGGEGEAGPAQQPHALSLGDLDAALNDTPLLAIGRYRVTCAAVALVGLAHRACAAAAAGNSPALARSLVAAVVDAAELAAALPPATRGRQLQLPQPAALFYCDCQHIARELLQLPYCYAPALRALCSSAPGALRGATQRLRDAGTAILQTQVTAQCQELADLLAGAEGWRWIADPQRAITGRRVVAQTLHTISRLSAALGDTLPPAAHSTVLCCAVETVCAVLCRDILALSDISVHESEEFPRILGPLLEGLPGAARGGREAGSPRVSPRGDSRQTAADSFTGQQAELEEGLPSLRKLKALLRLMAARLAEIRAAWADGSLAAAGLGAGEVAHLVRALFEDTSVRGEALAALALPPVPPAEPPGGAAPLQQEPEED